MGVIQESMLELGEVSSQEPSDGRLFIKEHQTQVSSYECRVRKASPEEIASELARLGIK